MEESTPVIQVYGVMGGLIIPPRMSDDKRQPPGLLIGVQESMMFSRLDRFIPLISEVDPSNIKYGHVHWCK